MGLVQAHSESGLSIPASLRVLGKRSTMQSYRSDIYVDSAEQGTPLRTNMRLTEAAVASSVNPRAAYRGSCASSATPAMPGTTADPAEDTAVKQAEDPQSISQKDGTNAKGKSKSKSTTNPASISKQTSRNPLRKSHTGVVKSTAAAVTHALNGTGLGLPICKKVIVRQHAGSNFNSCERFSKDPILCLCCSWSH